LKIILRIQLKYLDSKFVIANDLIEVHNAFSVFFFRLDEDSEEPPPSLDELLSVDEHSDVELELEVLSTFGASLFGPLPEISPLLTGSCHQD